MMYDLAVYLPGGAVLLVVCKFIVESLLGHPIVPTLIPKDGDSINLVIRAILWVSASYLAGHLGAFASTYLIEKFVHNSLGYPSDIWLETEKQNGPIGKYQDLREIFTDKIHNTRLNLVSIAILILQIPAFLPIIFFYFVKPFGFYAPKIPSNLLPAVQKQFCKLHIDVKIEQGSRWEKLVEHFVANHCPLAYTRMYNYLVIYGALRLISFILLLVCWYLTIDDLLVKFNHGQNFTINYVRTLFYFSMSGIYIVSVMAFAKFNRRYFEETILAFILAPNSLKELVGGPRIS